VGGDWAPRTCVAGGPQWWWMMEGWVLDLGYLNFLMILLILNVNFEMLILCFNC
jgi:hypothetical protein